MIVDCCKEISDRSTASMLAEGWRSSAVELARKASESEVTWGAAIDLDVPLDRPLAIFLFMYKPTFFHQPCFSCKGTRRSETFHHSQLSW